MAVAPEVELRGLAAEALVRLAATDAADGGRRAIDTMVRLLATDSPDAWNVALKAAAATGRRLDVFRRAAVDERDALRQAAGLYAYLRWRPDDPDCLPVRLLTDLAAQVTITGQILHQTTGWSSTSSPGCRSSIYVNHPDRPDVVVQTSALWYEVLRNRLKLQLLNRKALVKVATPLVAQVYSKRLLETFLFSSPDEARRFFASDRAAIGRVVALFDPATNLAGRADDLAGLLQSPLPLTRMVGGMVVAIHSFHDPAGTDAFVRDLFGRLDDAGRRWLLWAHAVLVEKAPAAWVGLLEDLTRTFVDENRAAFLAADGGTGAAFEVDLLPLGLAYGKRGGPMPYFGTLLSAAAADRTRRCSTGSSGGWRRWGSPTPMPCSRRCGSRSPSSSTRPSRTAWPPPSPPSGSSTPTPSTCSCATSAPPTGCGSWWPGRGDMELVRRYVVWVGFYNNGVHQALFHPKMRVGLLAVILDALATAKDAKAFVRQITPGPLEMLRQADYHLERWTEA